MTRHELMGEVSSAFGGVPRPQAFIAGTCQCEECAEHGATMQAFSPDRIPLDKLNNPGWDPICFASDEAFLYLMPGLVALLLDHPEEYFDQFIFHAENAGRIAAMTASQRQALRHVLEFFALQQPHTVDSSDGANGLFRTQTMLEQCDRG